MKSRSGFSAILMLITLLVIGYLIVAYLKQTGNYGSTDAHGRSGPATLIDKARDAVKKAREGSVESEGAMKAFGK